MPITALTRRWPTALAVGSAALMLAGGTDLGRYLAAAGWLLHGAWDFVHLKRRAVVVRSYAE